MAGERTRVESVFRLEPSSAVEPIHANLGSIPMSF